MARLPQPGGDNGNWGDILNDFLAQSLKNDGTIKSDAVTTDALAPNSVNATVIADGTIDESLLDMSLQTKLNSPATIPDGYITNAKIADNTVALTKLTGSVQASLAKADSAVQSIPVTSVANKVGAITLVKGDVGLGSIDNTSDASKPISIAQQAALDLKADVSTVAAKLNSADLDSQTASAIATTGTETRTALAATIPFPAWKPASGTWMQPRTGALSTTVATVGNFYFVPFFIAVSFDVTNVQVEVTTASSAAGSLFAGIYPTNPSSGLPDLPNIIIDLGSLSSTTTGVKNFIVPQFTLPAGLLWFGFGCTGSAYSYRSQAGTMPWGLPWPAGTTPVAGTGGTSGGAFSLQRTGLTAATAMPTNGGVSSVSAIAGPIFFLLAA